LALPVVGEAHGLWLTKRLDRMVLSLGHDDQEDGYSSAKLTSVVAVAQDGTPLPAPAIDEGTAPYWSFTKPPELAMLAVTYRGSMSGQRPDNQWIEGPRGTDRTVLKVGRYDKYLLAVVDPAADVRKAPATRMQIVPDRNPLSLKRGDRMGVRLLIDGRPLAGVAIAADYAGNADVKHAVTDAAGQAEITVQNQGLNVIGAMWIEPVAGDPEIDFIEHLATLSFALRPFSHLPGYRHPAMQ